MYMYSVCRSTTLQTLGYMQRAPELGALGGQGDFSSHQTISSFVLLYYVFPKNYYPPHHLSYVILSLKFEIRPFLLVCAHLWLKSVVSPHSRLHLSPSLSLPLYLHRPIIGQPTRFTVLPSNAYLRHCSKRGGGHLQEYFSASELPLPGLCRKSSCPAGNKRKNSFLMPVPIWPPL